MRSSFHSKQLALCLFFNQLQYIAIYSWVTFSKSLKLVQRLTERLLEISALREGETREKLKG